MKGCEVPVATHMIVEHWKADRFQAKVVRGNVFDRVLMNQSLRRPGMDISYLKLQE
jgi:hypothetical protein